MEPFLLDGRWRPEQWPWCRWWQAGCIPTSGPRFTTQGPRVAGFGTWTGTSSGLESELGLIAKKVLEVDTPGLCRADLRIFPYRRVRRPIFPLDDI